MVDPSKDPSSPKEPESDSEPRLDAEPLKDLTMPDDQAEGVRGGQTVPGNRCEAGTA